MKNKRTIMSIAIASVMAVGLTPLLAGCVNPIQAAIEQGVKDAAGNAVGGNVDLNVGGNGASMPTDWPSVVPVISGTIQSSARLGAGDSETWTVSVTTDSGAAAWSTIKSDFESVGFTTDFEATTSDGSMGSFSNGTFVAVVTVSTDSSGTTATYVVSLSASTQ